MILVLGEMEDTSSDKVCSWLNYYGKRFLRINDDHNNLDIVDYVYFTDNEYGLKLRVNDCSYDFEDFDFIWCRRGYIVFSMPSESSLNITANKIPFKIDRHLSNEIETLNKYLEFLIENKQHINSPSQYNSNKLIALYKAKKAGLKIPKTIITQSRSELISFVDNNGKCITKNIQDNLSYHDNNYTFGHGTIEVSLNSSDTDSFFYSLFQNKINKKYELRIFYLLGKFYASAALPPFDSNESDIRATNKKNRRMPFNLPNEIKNKLHNFMLDMKLESGSIDVMVDKNNDYWFLEVNPVGQFDFLSGKNNFYIERAIAKTLINGSKNKSY
jgi:ATP-GRASP peptide maturase of grasp-with-spasm system